MNIRSRAVKFFSTFGGVGYLPLIPGTWGSLVGLVLFFLMRQDVVLFTSVTAALLGLGFYVCGKAEKEFGKKDPKYVVIDEVVGMLLTLCFIPPCRGLMLIGFFLFRVFDTLKPFPIALIQDREKGSFGIMADDILAAFYANIVLQGVLRGIPLISL